MYENRMAPVEVLKQSIYTQIPKVVVLSVSNKVFLIHLAGGAGWVAFTLLLIAVLAALGVLWFKKRGKR